MSIRIHPYISEINHARLMALADRPQQSISKIVNTSLDAYFTSSPDSLGGHAVMRGMARLTGQYRELEKTSLVIRETLSLYVRYFMMITPPVPADRQDAAQAAGDLRFETFVDQLGIELQSGRHSLQRAVDMVLLDESDLYSAAQLDALHVPAPETDGGSKVDAQ